MRKLWAKGQSGNPERQFKKGTSANPGGRPKDHEQVRDLCRKFTVEAVTTLGKLMADKKVAASCRIAAAAVLLERGWGKPVQQIEVKRTPFDELDSTELRALAGALENLADEEGGSADGNQGTLIEGEAVELQSVQ